MWKTIMCNYAITKQVSQIGAILNYYDSIKMFRHMSSNSNTTDKSSLCIKKKPSKRTKLSPMSRISEMLSDSHNKESVIEDSNGMNNKHSDIKEIKDASNPINYHPSNPRSTKNMSYLDEPSGKADIAPKLPRMMRRKLKSLSVEDRIQSLNDEERDKD